MSLLPSRVSVPFRFAQAVEFIGDNLSARDISYAVAVGYIASRMPRSADETYRIPDNGLRAALGLTRRDSIENEVARFKRLRDGLFRIGERHIIMPTLLFMNDEPVRHNLDDGLTWDVPDVVRDLFVGQPDEPTVAIPLALLQNARSRNTLEIFLKLAAWHVWQPPATVSSGLHHLTVRFSWTFLRDRFYQVDVRYPSRLIEGYLQPAADDAWNAAGIDIQIKARRTVTRRNPKGKIRDVEIHLGLPIDDAAVPEPEEERQGGWQTPPAFSRPRLVVDNPPVEQRPAGPPPQNVTVLTPPRNLGFDKPAPPTPDDDDDENTIVF